MRIVDVDVEATREGWVVLADPTVCHKADPRIYKDPDTGSRLISTLCGKQNVVLDTVKASEERMCDACLRVIDTRKTLENYNVTLDELAEVSRLASSWELNTTNIKKLFPTLEGLLR